MNSLFPDPNATPSDGGLIANILAQYAAAPPDTAAPLSPIEQQMMGMAGPNQPVTGLGPAFAAQPAAAPPDTSAPLSPIEQQMMGMTGPNQPASGLGPAFAAQPAAAPQPAAPAQPQNAPIAVGGYQMPRIGSGFPDDDTPAAPSPVPPQQPTPAAAPSPLDAIGNRLNAAGQSLGHGGGLIGGLTALVTGQRHDPQFEATQLNQAALQKQVDALVNAGVPQKQAQLAVLNPKAAESILPQYLGPDKNKFIKIGQDGLGREQYRFVNEQDKTVTPVKSPGGDNSDAGLGDMSKTGAAYLATLPPQQRGTVQAMVEGRMAPPSSFALSKPYWQNMISAAQNVDPTFDSTNWSGRVAGVKDFASGKSAEMVRSANQALHHTGKMLGSMDDLNNGSYPALNWMENKANEATGGGAPTAFRLNARAVADELGKMWKGSGLSDAEIHAWEDNLSPNMSPEQQRAAVGKLKELLQGSLQALDEKRVGSMGQAAADKAGPIIKEEGQKVLKQLDAWLAKGNASGAGGTAPTGVKWSVVQ